MNHSRVTFEESLKQVVRFSKQSKNYVTKCQGGEFSSVQLQNLTNCWSLCMCAMLLNLVHKVKC